MELTCNMSAIEIHNIVETAWPNEAGTVRNIPKIVKSFKDGERTSFDRIEGQGKPTSTLRRESVELINDAINEDNSCLLYTSPSPRD